MKKFYNFVSNNDKSELYLYGAIVSDKWFEDEISSKDFIDAIEGMNENSTLEVYINSPGGEVFVTQSIISIIKRAKERKNIKLDCYIDGLGASCASWLPMLADNLYIYDGSMLMLHKPMTSCWGANSNDLRKEIELLDKIEDTEMIPMYMSKAKGTLTEDILRNMLDKETWLSADEIENYFNVTRLENKSELVACIDRDLFKNYKNVPKNLEGNKEKIEDQEIINKKKLLELELGLL